MNVHTCQPLTRGNSVSNFTSGHFLQHTYKESSHLQETDNWDRFRRIAHGRSRTLRPPEHPISTMQQRSRTWFSPSWLVCSGIGCVLLWSCSEEDVQSRQDWSSCCLDKFVLQNQTSAGWLICNLIGAQVMTCQSITKWHMYVYKLNIFRKQYAAKHAIRYVLMSHLTRLPPTLVWLHLPLDISNMMAKSKSLYSQLPQDHHYWSRAQTTLFSF